MRGTCFVILSAERACCRMIEVPFVPGLDELSAAETGDGESLLPALSSRCPFVGSEGVCHDPSSTCRRSGIVTPAGECARVRRASEPQRISSVSRAVTSREFRAMGDYGCPFVRPSVRSITGPICLLSVDS
jgi:hypothetical protein